MPSRPLVECSVAAHDRYGRASNPGGPEARGPSRGLPTCCLYKDLPAKSSQYELVSEVVPKALTSFVQNDIGCQQRP